MLQLLVRLASCGALATLAVRPAAAEDPVARGKYLTHHVAMCVQCHTPRDERGNLIESELFHGAPVPVEAPFPGIDWAMQAPNIAGLPGLTDAQEISLLTTGQARGRTPPRAPMPAFRLTREDAEAVVAYLRTLD